MEVKIKKLNENAVIPQYAKFGDAGMDLVATSVKYNEEKDCYMYGTGLAIEIPLGYVGLLFPRSSINKMNLILTNHVGVVDSGYRGEIMLGFKKINNDIDNIYQVGERIAQLMIVPYPFIEFMEVEELSKTDRGEGGYGSTGK